MLPFLRQHGHHSIWPKEPYHPQILLKLRLFLPNRSFSLAVTKMQCVIQMALCTDFLHSDNTDSVGDGEHHHIFFVLKKNSLFLQSREDLATFYGMKVWWFWCEDEKHPV